MKLVNRAKMTITAVASSGTGSLTLGAASSGFQTFAAAGVANNDKVSYVIEGPNAGDFEIGTGVYTASGTTLSRTPTESSNSNNAITATTDSVVFLTAAAADIGPVVHANVTSLLAQTGMVVGDMAFIEANKNLMMYTANGWWLVGTLTNATPSAISGANATYGLSTSGTATVVTLSATDPEGFSLSYSYAVTSGSLGSTATVAQNNNVFTITPSTSPSNAGSFSLTFSASDGNTASSTVSAFTLSFTPPLTAGTIKNGANTNDYFGYAVGCNSTHYAVCAQRANKLYLYTKDGTVVTGFDGLTSSNSSFAKNVTLSEISMAVSMADKVQIFGLTSTTPQITISNPDSSSGAYGDNGEISPDGNYLAVCDWRHNSMVGRVYVYSARSFTDSGGTSRTQGDLIHTYTGDASGTTSEPRFGDSVRISNDYVMIGSGNFGSGGKVHLYNLTTGAEVTSGVWPYTGGAYAFAGAISDDYAIIHDKAQSTGPLLVDLSDHSSVRRLTFTGGTSQYVKYYHCKYALTGTHVIIGDHDASTNSLSTNGAIYAFALSDNSQYTASGVWPIHGSAADEKLTNIADSGNTMVARGGNLVYGSWVADTNSLTNNGIAGIYT